MPDIDLEAIVGILITLFVVFLLGYVFFLVFLQLSLTLAIFFILAIAVIVIGILLGIFRRE
jgi:hypothetical protein